MKKGVLKIAAYCMAGVIVLGNTGVAALAAGFDQPLAGMGAQIAESQKQKEAAGVVKVQPTGYDTIAIAQVDEYVNIRDAASVETGNVVGKLYNNCKAEILGQSNGWYLIKSGGVTGYVSSDYFVTGSQAQELAREVGTDMATVKEGTETLMVRSSADSSAEAISMVGDYEKMQVLEDNGDWVKVAMDDDLVGYVSKEYVDCNTEFKEAESVEEVEARKAAVQDAFDRATQMQEAAYAAMNAADGNEAAYAAQEANAALAQAKMLASQQEFDYEVQEIVEQVAYVAQDTAVASVWAQEAEAEYERIAAEEAAAAAAAAAAEEAARQEQARQEAEWQAAEEAANAQANADNQEQLAQQKENEAAEAWQEAVNAQEQADADWSEEAQAEADAAAAAAMQAAAEAEAARQQAEAEQQAAEEAARQRALAEQQAAEEAARQEAAQQRDQQQSSSSGDTSGSSESSSSGSSSAGTRQSVVNYALQFVGNPYVWGGTSLTNGADCSGFTLSVMAHFGVGLPRTAAEQANAGTPVSLDAIQPGDLLFYQGGSGIGHVTMYIGNGQVVHASNPSTGIVVSNIGYRTPSSARSFF